MNILIKKALMHLIKAFLLFYKASSNWVIEFNEIYDDLMEKIVGINLKSWCTIDEVVKQCLLN